jgi:HSP20 family protein
MPTLSAVWPGRVDRHQIQAQLKKKEYYLSERRYGSFQRSFPVPESVDANKIEAKFVNGVLTVRLPKSPEAQKNEKRIAIKKG